MAFFMTRQQTKLKNNKSKYCLIVKDFMSLILFTLTTSISFIICKKNFRVFVLVLRFLISVAWAVLKLLCAEARSMKHMGNYEWNGAVVLVVLRFLKRSHQLSRFTIAMSRVSRTPEDDNWCSWNEIETHKHLREDGNGRGETLIKLRCFSGFIKSRQFGCAWKLTEWNVRTCKYF